MSKASKKLEAKHAKLLAKQRKYHRNKVLNVHYNDSDKIKYEDSSHSGVKFFTKEEIASYSASC